MPTIDLSTPPPPPRDLLDGLPRRVGLTLAELRFVAEAAGGAPLPFEVAEPTERPALEDRLGTSRGTSDDAAFRSAVDELPDAEVSLARRGLLTGAGVDDAVLGAVGLLATPHVALDLDVVVDGVRGKAWHRQQGGAVASLATADGLVFELSWFPVAAWATELSRVGVLSEDVERRTSLVPPVVDLPYELADAAGEALRTGRHDLVPVLVAQHDGAVVDADGKPLPAAEVGHVLAALNSEARGRLRVLAAEVAGAPEVVGVVSWTLLADGWHALRPHRESGTTRVEVRRVTAEDLAADLSPVLAEVTR